MVIQPSELDTLKFHLIDNENVRDEMKFSEESPTSGQRIEARNLECQQEDSSSNTYLQFEQDIGRSDSIG